MAISPGTYLRRRREAAGLSIETVAQRVTTEPHLAEHDRLTWLRMIEADEIPMGPATIDALRKQFPFSNLVLAQLDRLHRGLSSLPPPRLCRVCACSEHDACNTSAGRCGFIGCHWVAEDLCSNCVNHVAAAAPAPIGRAA